MTFLYAIVLLGILIFVHELGHFIFAKALGVKVLKFSLGFGPRLVGKTLGETEYCISAFPLGGYVKMLGEEQGEELEEADKRRAYSEQPVWKRFSIVFFGPIFNLLFAAVVFVGIFFAGVPVSNPDIGPVTKGSPAAVAGFKTGDRVLAIDGDKVLSWDDVERTLDESRGRELLFSVKRDGNTINVRVAPEKKVVTDILGDRKEEWEIGAAPLIYPVVGEVMNGTPAEKAGLKKGDRITSIGQTAVDTWQDMTSLIHASPGVPLQFHMKRDGHVMDVTIVPEKKTVKSPTGEEKDIGLIGIAPEGNDFIRRYGPARAISLGFQRTWDVSVLTVLSIVKLIQRIIPAETIGGPIMIFEMAGRQASIGALNFFTFMAIISINLGILNLLPIPILDGGHLMFLTIEAIRKRPLSEKVVMVAQRVGLALLISLMVFALYNDIVRLITGKMFP